MENNKNEVKSVLKMLHIVVDNITFSRNGFHTLAESKDEFKVGTGINKDAEGEYRVTLEIIARRKGEFEASVRMTGYFQVDEENDLKEELLKKNAVAIMFPFVRAELTLITSQPETLPIVLPAMNINALLSQRTEE